MANVFSFSITAVDKATATVRAVKRSIAEITAPITKIRQSFKTFSKEIGIDKLGAGFRKMGGFVKDAAGVLGKFGVGMAAITSLATISGMAALVAVWSKLGFGVGVAAQTLGLSAKDLQTWRVAANAMDIDNATLDNSFKSLGQTIQDATYGRNQQALVFMNRLGIAIHRTKTGAIDTQDEMIQLSAAIARFKGRPQVQEEIAQTFGVEGLLPLLRKGPVAVRAALAQAAASGAVMNDQALANADRTHDKMVRLGQTWQRLQNTVFGSSAAGRAIDFSNNLIAPDLTAASLAAKAKAAMSVGLGPGGLLGLGIQFLLPDKIAGLDADKMFAGFAPQARAVGEQLKATWSGVSSAIADDWKGLSFLAPIVWTGISASVQSTWTALTASATLTWARITSLPAHAWTAILNQAKSDWAGIAAFFSSTWDHIAQIFTAGVARAIALVKSIPNLPGQAAQVLGNAAGAVAGWAGHDAPKLVGDTLKRAAALRDSIAKDLGLTRAQAAGVVSNLWAESGLVAQNEKHPLVPGSRGGFGWGQWTGPRRREFEAYAAAHHLDVHSDAANYGFLVEEVKRKYGAVLRRVQSATSARDAARAFFAYESGGDPFLAPQAGRHAAAADQIAAAGGSVDVNVRVEHNGDRAIARTRSSGNVRAHARVEHSLHPIPA